MHAGGGSSHPMSALAALNKPHLGAQHASAPPPIAKPSTVGAVAPLANGGAGELRCHVFVITPSFSGGRTFVSTRQITITSYCGGHGRIIFIVQ
jgi:hypothetical protein